MGIEPMTFGNRRTENRCGKPLRYVPNTSPDLQVFLFINLKTIHKSCLRRYRKRTMPGVAFFQQNVWHCAMV